MRKAYDRTSPPKERNGIYCPSDSYVADELTKLSMYLEKAANALRQANELVPNDVVQDAERFQWLLEGNGYFMEEHSLCGHAPCTEEEKQEARERIDEFRNRS